MKGALEYVETEPKFMFHDNEGHTIMQWSFGHFHYQSTSTWFMDASKKKMSGINGLAQTNDGPMWKYRQVKTLDDLRSMAA